MEWMKTNEYVEMLKRFPGTKVLAMRYTPPAHAIQTWSYLNDAELFVCHDDEEKTRLSESDFLKQYEGDYWRPDEFFHLTDERQRAMAVRIVEQMITLGRLDEILTLYHIEFARECQHCHALMNEGWLCGDTYTFCSDECLLAENPALTEEDLARLSEDEYSLVDWNEWEDLPSNG